VGNADSSENPKIGLGMDEEVDLPINVCNLNGGYVTIRLRRSDRSSWNRTCYEFKRVMCHQTGSCDTKSATRFMNYGPKEIYVPQEHRPAEGDLSLEGPHLLPIHRTWDESIKRRFRLWIRAASPISAGYAGPRY
jgi:hypothetical protein